MVQSGFRLLGEDGEDHRDVICGVLVARATDDDTTSVDDGVVTCPERQGHFGPRGERSRAAEFDAATVDDDGVLVEAESRFASLDGQIVACEG